jgi:tyrosyl-tRNA synthetase
MTTPLLEGLDGVNKMSKSLNNYIGIDEPAGEMFGKVMSISDALMWRYYELLTDVSSDELNAMKFRCESGAENPRDAKVDLAKRIITDFHSKDDADAAADEFERRFVRKEAPDDVEEKRIASGEHKLADLLVLTGLAASKGEARRLIEQGGVKADGKKISEPASVIEPGSKGMLIQVGKRKFLRVLSSE